MNKPFSLIVTDTSPLFTLGLADALDTLLRPGLAVSIPDAVYVEATRAAGATAEVTAQTSEYVISSDNSLFLRLEGVLG